MAHGARDRRHLRADRRAVCLQSDLRQGEPHLREVVSRDRRRAGCAMLAAIGRELRVPVTTDVHSPEEAQIAAEFIDILQIPAFLCRQTDLIQAAAETGRVVNVKKGQFLAPWDVRNIAEKLRAFGSERIFLHRARRDVRLQQSRGGHALALLDPRGWDIMWSSTPRIRCSVRAARATRRAATACSRRCWRARRWRRVATAFLSRRTRIRRQRSPTGRIRFRWQNSRRC